MAVAAVWEPAMEDAMERGAATVAALALAEVLVQVTSVPVEAVSTMVLEALVVKALVVWVLAEPVQLLAVAAAAMRAAAWVGPGWPRAPGAVVPEFLMTVPVRNLFQWVRMPVARRFRPVTILAEARIPRGPRHGPEAIQVGTAQASATGCGAGLGWGGAVRR